MRYHLSLFVLLSISAALRAEENMAANEMAAAAACKAFAEGEEIYHRTDYDADGVLEYAQSLRGGLRAPVTAPDAAKLPKPTAEEEAQIARLIKNLGSEEFTVREDAAKDLSKMGPKALSAVQAAQTAQKDPEIVSRCRTLAGQFTEALMPERKAELRNGLFISVQNGKEMELALIDRSFANAECPLGTAPKTVTPKNGYLFRVLTKQGKATGAERNFIIGNGNMCLGYAFIAFPKEYGVNGKRCFMISNSGTIFERDLGSKEKTEAYVKECDSFNPVAGEWAPTE